MQKLFLNARVAACCSVLGKMPMFLQVGPSAIKAGQAAVALKATKAFWWQRRPCWATKASPLTTGAEACYFDFGGLLSTLFCFFLAKISSSWGILRRAWSSNAKRWRDQVRKCDKSLESSLRRWRSDIAGIPFRWTSWAKRSPRHRHGLTHSVNTAAWTVTNSHPLGNSAQYCWARPCCSTHSGQVKCLSCVPHPCSCSHLLRWFSSGAALRCTPVLQISEPACSSTSRDDKQPNSLLGLNHWRAIGLWQGRSRAASGPSMLAIHRLGAKAKATVQHLQATHLWDKAERGEDFGDRGFRHWGVRRWNDDSPVKSLQTTMLRWSGCPTGVFFLC